MHALLWANAGIMQVWSTQLDPIASIFHPAGDIYSIVALNQDIAVASEQGVVVYTSDAARAADPETLRVPKPSYYGYWHVT